MVDGEGPGRSSLRGRNAFAARAGTIRACDVDDRPDLLERGLLIDISAGKVRLSSNRDASAHVCPEEASSVRPAEALSLGL